MALVSPPPPGNSEAVAARGGPFSDGDSVPDGEPQAQRRALGRSRVRGPMRRTIFAAPGDVGVDTGFSLLWRAAGGAARRVPARVAYAMFREIRLLMKSKAGVSGRVEAGKML